MAIHKVVHLDHSILIYINDLPVVTNLHAKLFADDANLTRSNRDVFSMRNGINNELKKVDLDVSHNLDIMLLTMHQN